MSVRSRSYRRTINIGVSSIFNVIRKAAALGNTRPEVGQRKFVYYESMKRELKTKPIYDVGATKDLNTRVFWVIVIVIGNRVVCVFLI